MVPHDVFEVHYQVQSQVQGFLPTRTPHLRQAGVITSLHIKYLKVLALLAIHTARTRNDDHVTAGLHITLSPVSLFLVLSRAAVPTRVMIFDMTLCWTERHLDNSHATPRTHCLADVNTTSKHSRLINLASSVYLLFLTSPHKCKPCNKSGSGRTRCRLWQIQSQ